MTGLGWLFAALGIVVVVFVVVALFYYMRKRRERPIDDILVDMYDQTDRAELAQQLEGRKLTKAQLALKRNLMLTGEANQKRTHAEIDLGNAYLDGLLKQRGRDDDA
jgi:hypothetical protein